MHIFLPLLSLFVKYCIRNPIELILIFCKFFILQGSINIFSLIKKEFSHSFQPFGCEKLLFSRASFFVNVNPPRPFGVCKSMKKKSSTKFLFKHQKIKTICMLCSHKKSYQAYYGLFFSSFTAFVLQFIFMRRIFRQQIFIRGGSFLCALANT